MPQKMKKRDRLPKRPKKNDVFKLKMKGAYITVTVTNVKQKNDHSAKIVSYQYEEPRLVRSSTPSK